MSLHFSWLHTTVAFEGVAFRNFGYKCAKDLQGAGAKIFQNIQRLFNQLLG